MKILIATGGSGGHLFPALKVASKFTERKCEVFFIGAFGADIDRVRQKGYKAKSLDVKGILGQKIFMKIKSIFMQFKAIIDSACFIWECKPDLILGFGGYGSFPAVIAGCLLRCKTMIHEQNVIPGKANKLLSVFVDKIAVSFEQSRKYFPEKKTVVTGCPVAANLQLTNRISDLSEFGFESSRKTVLIFGGSQGSARINRDAFNAVSNLSKEMPIQAFHVTGNKDYDVLVEEYNQLNIPHVVFKFFEPMNKAYQLADLVIARAGASTVTELAIFKKKSILIPYPYAGNHQIYNALILSEKGLAQIIEEESLSSSNLKRKMIQLLNEEDNLNFDQLVYHDADSRLVNEAMNLN